MLRMLWVAAYDLGKDRERRQLERHLAAVGERAQYSVFEVWLSERERERLQHTVARNISLAQPGDSIRWYPLCGQCQRHLAFLGRGLRPGDPRFYMV